MLFSAQELVLGMDDFSDSYKLGVGAFSPVILRFDLKEIATQTFSNVSGTEKYALYL